MTYVIIDGRGIIPDRVTKIDNSAFENCTRLETIVNPDSVTLIEEAAFANCENLKSIVIPDSVTKIEAWAFHFCNLISDDTVSALTGLMSFFCRHLVEQQRLLINGRFI